jgi:uncharacterized membrane protein
MDSIDLSTMLIIFCVAIGTYTLRVSGLLISNRLSKEGRIKIFLDYLPSTLLLSLIAPSIVKEGVTGVIATILVVFCMYKTNNTIMAMVIGMVVVALSRNFL